MNLNVWRPGSKSVQIPETEHLPAAEVRIQCGNGDFSRKIARMTAEAGNAYLATGLTPLRLAADRAGLLEALNSAANYVDALGGDSKRYRSIINIAAEQPHG